MTKPSEAFTKLDVQTSTGNVAESQLFTRSRPPKSRFSQGRRVFLETLFLVAIVTAITCRWSPENAYTFGYSLYWIPITLMAGQYGSRAGLFATLAASAASLAIHMPPRLAEQDYFGYAASLSAEPSVWLVYSLAIGGLRDLQRSRESRTSKTLAETREAGEIVAEALDRALSEIERLEKRIVTDCATLDGFVYSLRNLEIFSESEFLPSFAKLVREATSADMVGIYIRHGDDYLLTSQVCATDGARQELPVAPASLVEYVRTANKVVRWDGATPPADSPLGVFAAPVASYSRSRLHGILVMHLPAPGCELDRVLLRAERLAFTLGNFLDIGLHTSIKLAS